MTRLPAGGSSFFALLLTTLILVSSDEIAWAAPDSMDPATSQFAQRATFLLQQATEGGDPAEAARAHYQLGRHFNSVGLFSQAEAQARMAAGLIDRDSDPELGLDVDLMLGAVLMRMGRGHEAAEILLSTLDEVDRLGLIEAGVRARITLSTVQSQAGAPEAARSTALAALETAEAHDMTDWMARLLINLMRIELTMPAKQDRLGEPWMSRILELDPRALADETQISLLLAQLFYARTSGQLDDAVTLSDRVARQAEERGNVFLSGMADRETAQLFCDQGALDRARARFESSVTKLEQTDDAGEIGVALNIWSDCEASAGNFERALELKRRGTALLNEGRQRRQDELLVSASLAFNTEQNLRELDRLTARETLLSASLDRERWRASALLAFSGLLLAVLAIGWLRLRRLRERQQAEQRLAQTRIDLLARTSHEIRNPAQGLSGLLESLVVQSPPLMDDAGFKAALGGSRLIEHLARDYLDLAMSELDRLTVDAQHVCETRAIVEGVRHLTYGLFPMAEDRLVLIVGDEVPERIRTDGDRLTQILLNGVINAFRHGGSGSVALRVGVSEGGDQLRFEIEDNGPGFRCKEQRLFEPYWQASGSDSRGSGLGLAVSAAIVKRLGGTIEARNLQPHGAMLMIRLPIEPLPATADVEDRPSPFQADRRFPHVRVAILDDDAFSLLGLSAMAEALGCRVETANDDSGLEACLATFDPHLVILDQQLGHSTGEDIARRIRDLDAGMGREHRRILIVSGIPRSEQAGAAIHDEWLLKPLSLRTLSDHLVQIDPASGQSDSLKPSMHFP